MTYVEKKTKLLLIYFKRSETCFRLGFSGKRSWLTRLHRSLVKRHKCFWSPRSADRPLAWQSQTIHKYIDIYANMTGKLGANRHCSRSVCATVLFRQAARAFMQASTERMHTYIHIYTNACMYTQRYIKNFISIQTISSSPPYIW